MINYIKTASRFAQTGRSLLLSCAKDTPSSFERCVQNGYTSEKVASRFAQTGRSMIEMLGVLAIIGVLSVGGIAGYSKAMMKHKINRTIEQITTIVNGARVLYANQGNYREMMLYYPSRDSSPLVKGKVIPEDMLQKPNQVTHAFGGNVRAITGTAKYKTIHTPNAILMYFMQIPQQACIALATQNWNDNDLIYMGINDTHSQYADECTTAASNGSAIQCAKDGLMSVENATLACNKETDNVFVWLFE